MRIVCPHAGDGLKEETRDCLDLSGLDVEYRDTSGSEHAYGALLSELWAIGDGFVLVEQDMAFETEQLYTLIDCPKPYCAGVYDWVTNTGPALGFTKFTRTLIASCPDAARGLSRMSWRQLDVFFMRTTLGCGYGHQPHVHLPPIQHLNEEKSPLREEFRNESLGWHLGHLGWQIDEDGKTASYLGGRFFGAPRAA